MRFFLIAAFMTAVLSAGSGCEKKQADANPFFTVWDTPFGVPPFDKIKNGHYKPAIEKGIADHAAEIDSIVANPDAPSFENVIAALDRSGELLKKAYAAFAQVKAADSNDELQEADLAIAPAVSAHYDDIYLNDRLFEKISAVHEQIGGMALSAEQIRLTEQTYKQFVRAGAQLNARQKERLRDINRELSLLSVRFGNNLLAETRDFTLVVESSKDISGVPQTVTDAAADKAKEMGMTDKWVFTLSPPSMIPFLTYAENRGLREKLYTGYVKRGSNGNQFDNRQIVNDIIRLRTEKARLMDYPSYAAFVLDDRMAKTPERVYDLLDKLWKPALDTAKRELETLRAIKAKETQDSAFAAWDWRYYAEKVRKSQYNLDQTSLNLYFSLDNVRSGVFQLSNRLWGLTFRPVSVPVYNKECSAYEVLDKDNTHLGVLYFDLYPRDGKRGGAWCGTFREASYGTDGKRIAPIVTIVCNFTRPNGSDPAQLTLDETETLFHEFGHALHKLFSQVRYAGLNRVERDFVELPSQIMENWATEPEMLRLYAKHLVSGEPMPESLIRKIRKSRQFNQGFATTDLVAAALSDIDIHTIEDYKPFDPEAFEKEALNDKRGLIGQIEPRYRYPYFNHIFNSGYAAGYYGYLWAEVLDRDAFEAFVESGDIFDKATALSFRKNILERGGTQDGAELYRNFRGKDPDITPMMVKRGLIKPVEPPADSVAAATPVVPQAQ